MISITTSGTFNKTEKFLRNLDSNRYTDGLDSLAREGVAALKAHTPVDSGETANSWDYTIERKRGSTTITWTNSHIDAGAPVAIMLQYGHGTGTGGYVQGRDFINPAIRPVFDDLADKVWKAVTR